MYRSTAGAGRRRPAASVHARAEALEGRRLLAVNTFTSAGNINLADGGASGADPATPYPRDVTVPSTFAGHTVTDVTVRLNGIDHTTPDDLDIMLVAPGAQGQERRLIIWSDSGGAATMSNRTVTLSDAASTDLPDGSLPAAGSTHRPTDHDLGMTPDPFPAPAPTPGAATNFKAFDGIGPVGRWSLYVVDSGESQNDTGTIDSWSLTITSTPPPTLIISEYRPHGPNGPNDEYVELYNLSDSVLTVSTDDGSSGWALRSSDNVTRFVVPNGTVVPGRGHFLAANSVGYSLSAYASPNVTYTANIPTGENGAARRGIALFRTSIASNITLANRLDAVGPTAETNTLFREGAGHGNISASAVQYSMHRSQADGQPKDSNNNVNDFVFADPTGTSLGAGQNLGAPGPENLSGPIQVNASLPASLLDPSVAANAVPNRQHDFTVGDADFASFGFHVARRIFTNNTGGAISRLRFRVADVSTFPNGDGGPEGADLRPTTIPDSTVATSGGNVLVRGTTLEEPPNQANGGGFNSSLAVPFITPQNPLAPGATIAIQFAFGLEALGDIRLALNAEAVVLGPGTNGPGDGPPLTDAGVAPLKPGAAPDLDASTDTGASNFDNLTADNTPLFNGTAAPNATVHLFAGGVLVASGVANAAGQYSINVTGGLPENSSNITAAVTTDNITSPLSPSLVVDVDTVGPAVSAVVVAGTAWTANFLNFLQSSGLGTGGFAVPAGAGQLLNLTWTNTNTIRIRFTEDVTVEQGDLSIRGVNTPTYAVANFAYTAATLTATWTLQAGMPADKVLLDLNGTAAGFVLDPAGNALDGNWANGADAYPSGDGTPGGDFEFRLHNVPGDVNRSGGPVNSLDLQQTRLRQFTSTADPGTPPNLYTVFHDVNGSSNINSTDVQLVRLRQFTGLPDGNPALASGRAAPAYGAAPLLLPRPRAGSLWAGVVAAPDEEDLR